MPLPNKLTDLLRVAGHEVARDPCGALTLARRQEIWTALGPVRRRGRRALRGPGLLRRFAVASQCVRQALPLWEGSRREDDMPQRLLQTAERYLARRVPFAKAKKLIGEGWLHADNVSVELADRNDLKGQSVTLVCYAASRALLVAVWDERFEPGMPPFAGEDTYGSGDPESMDVSYLVAAARSGGWPTQGDPGVKRRREFWRWYLEQAVSDAWNSVSRE
jgi:hypothetical protein